MRPGRGFRVGLAALAWAAAAARGVAAPVTLNSSGSRLAPAPAPAEEAPEAILQRLKAHADAASRMTVMVKVNGRGPFPFIIDTGADRTAISSELADALRLPAGHAVLMHSTGGVDLTPTAVIDDLDVGVREVRNVSAPRLAAGNIGAQGILGIDSLHDQRMVMDFRRSDLSVGPSKRWEWGAGTIVVRARSRFGQLVLVDAALDGRPMQVIVDSGAENTTGNLALERLVRRGLAKAQVGEVVSVSGRSTPARFSTLSQVRIGGATLRNVPIAFADLHTFAEFGMNDAPAMLLGMDVLRAFDRVAVDFRRRKVSFDVPPT